MSPEELIEELNCGCVCPLMRGQHGGSR